MKKFSLFLLSLLLFINSFPSALSMPTGGEREENAFSKNSQEEQFYKNQQELYIEGFKREPGNPSLNNKGVELVSQQIIEVTTSDNKEADSASIEGTTLEEELDSIKQYSQGVSSLESQINLTKNQLQWVQEVINYLKEIFNSFDEKDSEETIAKVTKETDTLLNRLEALKQKGMNSNSSDLLRLKEEQETVTEENNSNESSEILQQEEQYIEIYKTLDESKLEGDADKGDADKGEVVAKKENNPAGSLQIFHQEGRDSEVFSTTIKKDNLDELNDSSKSRVTKGTTYPSLSGMVVKGGIIALLLSGAYNAYNNGFLFQQKAPESNQAVFKENNLLPLNPLLPPQWCLPTEYLNHTKEENTLLCAKRPSIFSPYPENYTWDTPSYYSINKDLTRGSSSYLSLPSEKRKPNSSSIIVSEPVLMGGESHKNITSLEQSDNSTQKELSSENHLDHQKTESQDSPLTLPVDSPEDSLERTKEGQNNQGTEVIPNLVGDQNHTQTTFNTSSSQGDRQEKVDSDMLRYAQYILGTSVSAYVVYKVINGAGKNRRDLENKYLEKNKKYGDIFCDTNSEASEPNTPVYRGLGSNGEQNLLSLANPQVHTPTQQHQQHLQFNENDQNNGSEDEGVSQVGDFDLGEALHEEPDNNQTTRTGRKIVPPRRFTFFPEKPKTRGRGKKANTSNYQRNLMFEGENN